MIVWCSDDRLMLICRPSDIHLLIIWLLCVSWCWSVVQDEIIIWWEFLSFIAIFYWNVNYLMIIGSGQWQFSSTPWRVKHLYKLSLTVFKDSKKSLTVQLPYHKKLRTETLMKCHWTVNDSFQNRRKCHRLVNDRVSKRYRWGLLGRVIDRSMTVFKNSKNVIDRSMTVSRKSTDGDS